MEELYALAEKLGELKNLVKVDNPTGNFMVDAYNDGVDAMANQIASFISTVITANRTAAKGGVN